MNIDNLKAKKKKNNPKEGGAIMNERKTTIDATVREIVRINEAGAYLFALNVDEEFVERAKPGMFSSFLPKDGHTQRRPFSIVAAKRNTFPMIPCDWIAEFIIKDVGPNTNYFVNLRPGEKINITYPRGQAIKITDNIQRLILVGGGVGIAPIKFLSKRLSMAETSWTILEGAKEIGALIGLKWFADQDYKWITETHHRANKKTGLVTDLLQKELQNTNISTEVIACGPLPMMRAVAEICAEENISCQVILESVFACSQGACLGCAVFLADGTTKQICKDGPAFQAEELDWEKLLSSHLSPCKSSPAEVCSLDTVLLGRTPGRKLEMKTPIIGASGTQSLHSLRENFVDISGVGAILAKGLTLEPRSGNPAPRVCETPAGMLNSIGLENIGLEAFLAEELPSLLAFGKPVIANINGGSVTEYAKLAKALNKTPLAAMEINISCPNLKQGGMAFGIDPGLTFDVVQEVREMTDKFLIVKLTPNVTNIVEIAKAAVEAGADAISAINTLAGLAIDIHSRRPKLGNITGGLSGPAIKPVGVKMVRDLVKANLGVPIIGVGGITNAEDALEYLIAGASAVQIGTAGFTDEQVFTKVVRGIKEYMLKNGFYDMYSLINSLII